jgi:BirA family biotin operon repressor/biotin-[acetyl-CoA-carboxylase] ligase
LTTRDQILKFLRSQSEGYVSGQEISRRLDVSRAAVWKQIQTLRAQGFEFEVKHAAGYRLVASPDLLLAADIENGLNCRVIGSKVVALREITSTNSLIRTLADQGAPEGTLVVADRQSAGRGRLGRLWTSPAGVNLYCSLLLKPDIPVQLAPQMTFLSAVSVAETLRQVCRLPAVLKWPNDVLIHGAKIAGLLNEMNAETEQVHEVILGIGINLNMTADQLPPQLNYPATSVMLETGEQVDRLFFLRALLENFDRSYAEFQQQGFAPIRRRWEELSTLMNQRVVVEQAGGTVQGTVVGLDRDGALLLQTTAGKQERILAGDVRPI